MPIAEPEGPGLPTPMGDREESQGGFLFAGRFGHGRSVQDLGGFAARDQLKNPLQIGG